MRPTRLKFTTIVLFSLGCGDKSAPPVGPNQTAVASVQIDPAQTSIAIGSTYQLNAIVRDASGTLLTAQPVAWTSSNLAVVAVSSAGLVTGVAAGGPITITASSAGKSGAATVTVNPAGPIPVSSATMIVSARAAAFPGGPIQEEILSVNPIAGTSVNLTKHPGSDYSARISPNGEFILFESNRNYESDDGEVLLMRSDGSGVTRMPHVCPRSGDICSVAVFWLANGNVRYITSSLLNPSQDHVGEFIPPSGAPTINTNPANRSRLLAGPEAPSRAHSASYKQDGSILLHTVQTGVQTSIAPACTFAPTCWGLQWSDDSRRLYTHRQGVIWEYDVVTGAARQLYTGMAEIKEFALSPDGRTIALLENRNVKGINVATGVVSTIFTRFQQDVFVWIDADRELRWSRDSKSLAFASSYGDLRVVNADGTGQKVISSVGYPFSISW